MAALQPSVLFGDNVVTVHVGGDIDVPTLKAILEAETGGHSHNQALIFGTGCWITSVFAFATPSYHLIDLLAEVWRSIEIYI